MTENRSDDANSENESAPTVDQGLKDRAMDDPTANGKDESDATDREPKPQVDFGSISVLIPPSKAGDKDARNQLMRELQSYLEFSAHLHLDRSLTQKTGASDIVQQAFIRIIENFDKFRGSNSAELRGWINAIVANEMNGIRRKFRTAKRDFTQEKQIEAKSSTSPGNVPADGNLTPSSAAIQKERRQKFYETLGLLSDEHAKVIQLRNIERLSFNEIGELMGRSENAASKLWYRAILQFEEKLKAQPAFDEDQTASKDDASSTKEPDPGQPSDLPRSQPQ